MKSRGAALRERRRRDAGSRYSLSPTKTGLTSLQALPNETTAAQRMALSRLTAGSRTADTHRTTAELVVALLRSAIGTEASPDIPPECDWERLGLVAAHHGVLPILYRTLRDRDAEVPDAILQSMKLAYYANVLRNELAQQLAGEICAALGTEDIPVILLKGIALIRTLYDDPGLRRLSDLDLLVDERDVERAVAQLQRIDIEPLASPETGRGPLCDLHRVYVRPELRSLPVELHWRLFEGYQPYAFDLIEVWANRRPIAGTDDGACTMSFEHELAHLCLHLDRHAVMLRSLVTQRDWLELLLLPHGVARMVWLYDIAELIRCRTTMIDWESFVRTARAWALAGRLHAVLELCRRALGIAPPAEVMRALDVGRPRFAERFAQRVVLASHRANGHPDARFRWAKALSGDVLRLTHAWTSLFPPAAYLRSTYPGDHSTASRRIRHFREVLPRLSAEIQGRLRSFRGADLQRNNAQVYDQAFYDAFSENSAQSAALLLGLLYRVYRPRSVIDVGCGTGAWLAAAETLGSTQLKGLDGKWVPKEALMSKHIEFEVVDLAHPLEIDGQYDLCICVEVAEHVPATRAHTLVRALCGASDVVVFGAAITHQGGRGHVNEQWQSYWVSLFKDNNYECFDIFRGSLWDNDNVAWWYRQNTLLFVRTTATVIDRQVLRTLERPISDIVHPRSYELKVQRAQAQPQTSAPYGLRGIWGRLRPRWGRIEG